LAALDAADKRQIAFALSLQADYNKLRDELEAARHAASEAEKLVEASFRRVRQHA
jgi:hypothetical protein